MHFVIDAMESVDTRLAAVNQRGTGSEQYPPTMLLVLLVYSYATGVFSSRQIERSTYENVAVRLLCADTHSDHDTLCVFRRRNAALLTHAFARVLELAAGCGVRKVGGITVAIDGTKVLANSEQTRGGQPRPRRAKAAGDRPGDRRADGQGGAGRRHAPA